jgi:hypothetical protein
MSIKRVAAIGLCLFAGACSNYEGEGEPAIAPTSAAPPPAPAPAPSALDESGPVALDARVDMPAGVEETSIAAGECMTPVDYINGAPAIPGPYPAGKSVKVVGWNVTSSTTDSTPETIYGVFKPYDQAKSGALLSGGRTPRPDVAGENAQYAMAGFELEGVFPTAPGRYRFYIWTGSAGGMVECDSKIVINVQ